MKLKNLSMVYQKTSQNVRCVKNGVTSVTSVPAPDFQTVLSAKSLTTLKQALGNNTNATLTHVNTTKTVVR